MKISEEYLDQMVRHCGVPQLYLPARKSDIPASCWNLVAGVLEGKSLYVHGNVGTGKTHLVSVLIREKLAADPCHSPWFTKTPDMLAAIKEAITRQDREVSDMDVLRRYARSDCLYLDDLGSEKTTDWAQQTLTMIIDERYGAQKQTIVTSNLSLGGLKQKWGERISSRLTGMCAVVELKGKDRRSEGGANA